MAIAFAGMFADRIFRPGFPVIGQIVRRQFGEQQEPQRVFKRWHLAAVRFARAFAELRAAAFHILVERSGDGPGARHRCIDRVDLAAVQLLAQGDELFFGLVAVFRFARFADPAAVAVRYLDPPDPGLARVDAAKAVVAGVFGGFLLACHGK